MKTANYNVTAVELKTGIIRTLGTIVASTQDEANRVAAIQYLGKFNMMRELLEVAKA